MVEVLFCLLVYVVVVYPALKVAQAVRRGESIGLGGIKIVDDA